MYKEIFNNNYQIEIGRNQSENDILVRTSNKSSIWFHLKDQPSPHGILTCLNNSELDNTAISRTAELVKSFSKAKNHNRVSVEYLELAKIKKTTTPGLVILTKKPQSIVV